MTPCVCRLARAARSTSGLGPRVPLGCAAARGDCRDPGADRRHRRDPTSMVWREEWSRPTGAKPPRGTRPCRNPGARDCRRPDRRFCVGACRSHRHSTRGPRQSAIGRRRTLPAVRGRYLRHGGPTDVFAVGCAAGRRQALGRVQTFRPCRSNTRRTPMNGPNEDNHANQMNPNNDAYWESRDWDERPED